MLEDAVLEHMVNNLIRYHDHDCMSQYFIMIMTMKSMLIMVTSQVIYSDLPPAPDYQSWGGFDPRGMEHVYLIVHTFLDLILR